FCPIIPGTSAREQRKGPSRLTRITLRHSSTSVSHVLALAPAMPALLTRMSTRPNALSVASRASATCVASATSQATAMTLGPSVPAVRLANALSQSQHATFAPELRKRSLIALPKPCAPPVTTAMRPFKSMALGMDGFSVVGGAVAACYRALAVRSRGSRSPLFWLRTMAQLKGSGARVEVVVCRPGPVCVALAERVRQALPAHAPSQGQTRSTLRGAKLPQRRGRVVGGIARTDQAFRQPDGSR